MRSFKSLLPFVAMGLCALGVPDAAFAGHSPDPSPLPPCHSFGAAFAAPAHVMLEIASEGGNHDTVQVDDVYLIESRGAAALRRR